MEQIKLKTNISSNASSIIMDLSKSLNQNNSNISFKDYVKNKNQFSKNEYGKKENSDFEKRPNDDIKKNQISKESVNKSKVLEKKEEKKDNEIDDVKKLNNSQVKYDENDTEKTVDEIKLEAKEDIPKENIEIEEKKLDLQSLSLLQSLLNKVSEFNYENENFSKEEFQEVLGMIENIEKFSNYDVDKLSKLFNQFKLDKDINENILIDDVEDNLNIEEIIDLKKVFEDLDFAEKTPVQKKELQVMDISKEIDNLKQSIDFNMEDKLYISPLNSQIKGNIKSYDDESKLFLSDVLNSNVKIFDVNTKIFTNTKENMHIMEKIQNFSKIVDEMKLAYKNGKTVINIKLEPENLGKLSIKINSENGLFNATFFVESEKAKYAIENQIQNLRQALIQQGINIQDINVQVGQNNEDLSHHKNIMQAINFSKRNTIDEIENEEFEQSINPYISEDLLNDLI